MTQKNDELYPHSRNQKREATFLDQQSFMNASGSRDVNKMRHLLSTVNLDINRPDGLGKMTALHWRSKDGDIACMELLLDHNADINAEDEVRYTALHHAVATSQIAAIELLIHRRANVNAVDKFGSTPLHKACTVGCYSAAELLLKHGADVHMVDKGGKTALHLASVRSTHPSNVSLIELLLEHDANVLAMDERGSTALHSVGSVPCMELLINYGANINAVDKNGFTPLTRAVLMSNLRVVKYLASKGAKLLQKHHNGKTALDVANSVKNVDMIEYFQMLAM